MNVLIADDDAVNRRLLEATLVREGYTVTLTQDGEQALERLSEPNAPSLAILDWDMPGFTGLEVCQQLRANPSGAYRYVLLLTGRKERSDMLKGFEDGVDDYLAKPFDARELLARVRVGVRMVSLQNKLKCRIRELEQARAQIGELEQILPMCMHCKNVRSDTSSWEKLENYLARHAGTRVSHGLCESCLEQHYPDS
jgi:phosphoserine phosphatase RsbU/P